MNQIVVLETFVNYSVMAGIEVYFSNRYIKLIYSTRITLTYFHGGWGIGLIEKMKCFCV